MGRAKENQKQGRILGQNRIAIKKAMWMIKCREICVTFIEMCVSFASTNSPG